MLRTSIALLLTISRSRAAKDLQNHLASLSADDLRAIREIQDLEAIDKIESTYIWHEVQKINDVYEMQMRASGRGGQVRDDAQIIQDDQKVSEAEPSEAFRLAPDVSRDTLALIEAQVAEEERQREEAVRPSKKEEPNPRQPDRESSRTRSQRPAPGFPGRRSRSVSRSEEGSQNIPEQPRRGGQPPSPRVRRNSSPVDDEQKSPEPEIVTTRNIYPKKWDGKNGTRDIETAFLEYYNYSRKRNGRSPLEIDLFENGGELARAADEHAKRIVEGRAEVGRVYREKDREGRIMFTFSGTTDNCRTCPQVTLEAFEAEYPLELLSDDIKRCAAGLYQNKNGNWCISLCVE